MSKLISDGEKWEVTGWSDLPPRGKSGYVYVTVFNLTWGDPELLEALQGAVQLLGNHLSPVGREVAWKKIEDAMEKATGEK